MGGYERWNRVGEIRATAIVTTYDSSGTAHVNQQLQRIDIRNGKIVASARTGRGSWRATARINERCRLKARGFKPDKDTESRICKAIETLVHRVRGPLNLLGCDERAGSVTDAQVEGENLVRVAATDETESALGYFFDSSTGQLRFVTSLSQGFEQKETVTAYDYMMLGDGTAFPHRISVAEVGENVLVGASPILEVEFRKVEIR